MTQTNTPSDTTAKRAGVALIALSILTLGLMLNHPSGGAQTFADMLRDEAANSGPDAVVHGGFIVILVAQLIGLAILLLRIGVQRPLAIAGMVASLVGAGFLAQSMVCDGLLTPAIASHYLNQPDHQEAARPLFVLLGTTIRFAMSGGLIFQGLGLVAWGAALLERTRGIGGVCLIAGIAIVAGMAVAGGSAEYMMMAAMLLVANAYALIGVALQRRRV